MVIVCTSSYLSLSAKIAINCLEKPSVFELLLKFFITSFSNFSSSISLLGLARILNILIDRSTSPSRVWSPKDLSSINLLNSPLGAVWRSGVLAIEAISTYDLNLFLLSATILWLIIPPIDWARICVFSIFKWFKIAIPSLPISASE